MVKKRVSTRLTMDEYDLINGQAIKAKLSMSKYLKVKLFEPKVKINTATITTGTKHFW